MILAAAVLSFAFLPTTFEQVDPNEMTFNLALEQMATYNTMYLQMRGGTTYRGTTTPFVTSVSWSETVTPDLETDQVEIQEWVNDKLIKRIVGDGAQLWTYDLVTHEYSSSSYGQYGKQNPLTYRANLLSLLTSVTNGQNSYAAKLLRQIYGGNSTYTSWMPGIWSQYLNPGSSTFDPVNVQISYLPSNNDWYYLYNGAPNRSIVFEIIPQTTSGSKESVDLIQNVYMNQVESVGGSERYTHWKLTPFPSVLFSQAIFQPYTGQETSGWHMIVGPKATAAG